MDQSRSGSSSESENPDMPGSSDDKTTEFLESISDLDKILESSLYISKKSGSNSTDVEVREKCDISHASDLKESGPEILSTQSTLKESPSPYSSNLSRVKTPETTKNIIDSTSSASKKTVTMKQIVPKTSPYSRARQDEKRSYSLSDTQYFSNSDPKICSPEYHCKENLSLIPKSSTPIQNQACDYPRQFFHQSILDPKIDYKQDIDRFDNQYQALNQEMGKNSTSISPNPTEMRSHQSQVQPANIRTEARPIVLVSRRRRHDRMPHIRTNATRVDYIAGSYYRHLMPPIRTNATPMRYVQRPSFYQNPTSFATTNVTSTQRFQSPRNTSLNIPEGTKDSTDVTQSKLDSNPEVQDLKLPVTQPQQSVSKEIDSQNALTQNVEESEKLTKLQELAKRAHYSKKNMLNIDIPAKDPMSDFPYNSTPEGSQLQRTAIQFPMPPQSSGRLRSTFEVGSEIISQVPYHHRSVKAQSYNYPLFQPRDSSQAFTRPSTQDNFIYSRSNTCNLIHPAIRAQIMTHQRMQHQLAAIQNFTVESQYQNPNTSVYQYGPQYEPTMQNLTAESQHQYQNHPICQYGMQYQSNIQNFSAEPQYQDPNTPIHQYGMRYQPCIQNFNPVPQYSDPNTSIYHYGTQYVPTIAEHQIQDSMCRYENAAQNPTADFQHQDPNLAMFQYGTHEMPFGTFRPPDTPWCHPAYNTNILSQQHSSTVVPMQSFANIPSLTGLIQNPTWPYGRRDQSYPSMNDPNLMQNFSGQQTSVENLSSISVSQYPQDVYISNESTNPHMSYPLINDPNLMHNPSGMHTSVENPSSISDSQNTQEIYASNESANQYTNIYPTWSTLTENSDEEASVIEGSLTSFQ